jgi:hypothetical protein
MQMTSDDRISTKNVSGKLLQLEAKRMELGFLKMIVTDLKSYRKMIDVKKYD